MIELDRIYMDMALNLAKEAGREGEIPVGAVAVCDGVVVGKGQNRVERQNDPTAHAEIEAITAAANRLEKKNLNDVTLYVTLEPCSMCAGALVLARIKRVVYSVEDPKTGACGSIYRLHDDPNLNHSFPVSVGLMADEVNYLLKEFFEKLRDMQRLEKAKKDE